jgi:tRNA(Ile)-lysidine synthase
LYHSCVYALGDRLLAHIQKHELLKPGDRVGVAVSGGSDSVASLRLLLEIRRELGIVLSVVHLNHKLRGAESDADEEFVSKLATEHNLVLHATSAEVAKHAAESRVSIEAAARELRYDYFEQLLHDKLLDKVATGHTLDDQAETVLMRLVRGTGMRGLRAIQPRIQVDHDEASGEVVRPLLCIRHNELLAYLHSLDQPWREDSTNQESKYTRNRVRQVLLPLLEREFNPSVTQNLAELAEIARAEEEYWESEIEGWMGTVVQWVPAHPPRPENYVPLTQLVSPCAATKPPQDEGMSGIVDRNWLLAEPLALQRRVVKSIGDYADIPLEFKHIDEILQFAATEDGSETQLTLPRGWKLLREGASLEFKAPEGVIPLEEDYEYQLSIPGKTTIPAANLAISVVAVPAGASWEGLDRDQLFDPAQLTNHLLVRNWRPGDRFWPAHTKGPKKIKELLQEKHVPQAERRAWPVVLSEDEIVWVRGFPGRAHFRPDEGNEAILILELSLPGREINE